MSGSLNKRVVMRVLAKRPHRRPLQRRGMLPVPILGHIVSFESARLHRLFANFGLVFLNIRSQTVFAAPDSIFMNCKIAIIRAKRAFITWLPIRSELKTLARFKNLLLELTELRTSTI